MTNGMQEGETLLLPVRKGPEHVNTGQIHLPFLPRMLGMHHCSPVEKQHTLPKASVKGTAQKDGPHSEIPWFSFCGL